MREDLTDRSPTAGESWPAGANPSARPAADLAPAVLRRDLFKYLLLLRFILVNFIGGALLAAAAIQGWVGMVFSNDPTRLTVVICAVFVFGLVLCGWKIFRTSEDLNRAQAFDLASGVASEAARYVASVQGREADSRAITSSSLRQKNATRIAVVRHIANSLVLLGLIGTVIGFIIALSGVKPDSISEVENVAPMVSTLIEGMSIALYTTLVGAVSSVWLMVNYRLLATGTVTLTNAIIELGEAHARG